MTIDENTLKAWREICEKATAGPWFDNGYNRIDSEPQIPIDEKFHEDLKAAGYPSLEDKNSHWYQRYYESDATVAHVPPFAGDTSMGRHQADMIFIATARSALPMLLDEVERLQKIEEDYDYLKFVLEGLEK